MLLLLPRLLLVLLALIVGGLLGQRLSGSSGVWSGTFFAGFVGVSVIAIKDSLRGVLLLEWLRGSSDALAPAHFGPWAEVAARVATIIRRADAEAQLERRRLAEFVSAMEASPSGVLLLTAGNEIEWCNSLAADHFGLDPQRDRRQRVTNLIRSPAFVSYLQAGEFGDAVPVPDPSGRRSLQVIIRRYGDDAKLVLSQDLTERERSDAMRRDFVANVSHEIRTPLTVLSGFLETLRDLPLTDVEKERVIFLMAQQAERMGHLVGDLLTLAQLEGSPRPTSDRWVKVSHVFGQAEAQARALSNGRHVFVFGSPSEAEIAGTEGELVSAVANLVNNAVRYTQDGGSIELSWLVLDNGSGEVRVSDTGRGVARAHLSRLTERFYRVDGGRSRESGGTGLGLSIVKHVAQRHGGELDIVSELGRGSTFRLILPAVRIKTRQLETRIAESA